VHIGFWWGKLRQTDHLKDLGVDGGNNIKRDLQEVGSIGRMWLWIRTSGGHLLVREKNSGSIKCVQFLEYLRTC
jgi:hypothetical protein